MNKNIVLLIVLLVLSIGAFFLYQKSKLDNKMSSLSEERNFTVPSPEKIHKIILNRKNEDPLVFEKNDQKIWMINNTYRADEVVVGYMIQVLTKARMKSIPSKNAVEKIHNSIKANGIGVEVYDDKNEVLKIFYIASDLQSGDGTYFLMDGFQQPYAIELPSLGGGLRSRFEQPLGKYRDRFIYREPIETIQSVKVDYPKDPAASYIIEDKGGVYDISPVDNTIPKIEKSPNQIIIKTYLGFYEELGAELLYNHYEKRDSVLKLTPFCTITIIKKDKTEKKYEYWNYDEIVRSDPNKSRSVDAIHIGRFFVNTGDFYTVQSGVFGKLFAAYPYFF